MLIIEANWKTSFELHNTSANTGSHGILQRPIKYTSLTSIMFNGSKV